MPCERFMPIVLRKNFHDVHQISSDVSMLLLVVFSQGDNE